MLAEAILHSRPGPNAVFRLILQTAFRDELQFILLDTDASVTRVQERALCASDLVLLPSAADFPSADGRAASLHMLASLQQKGWRGSLFGILPTFCEENSRENQAVLEDLQQRFPSSLLSPIHRSPFLRECASQRKTIFEFDPLCRVAKEYLALTRRLLLTGESDVQTTPSH